MYPVLATSLSSTAPHSSRPTAAAGQQRVDAVGLGGAHSHGGVAPLSRTLRGGGPVEPRSGAVPERGDRVVQRGVNTVGSDGGGHAKAIEFRANRTCDRRESELDVLLGKLFGQFGERVA